MAATPAELVTEKIIVEAVQLRRQLHRIPEIAWEEKKTAALLRNWLKVRGVSSRAVAGTGTIAEIVSGKGRTLAIRSDIDGLPIEEATGLPFRSLHPGRMHACGHDLHMATVASTAAALARVKEGFHGRVKFIFQPAEEEPPGGAQALIKAGVMRNPKVDMIFGLHVNPGIPVGKIGLKEGPLMAGVVDFNIEIQGRGGHAALPHLTSDSVVCASALIAGLQTIVSRNVDPIEPAVISIGKIEGGSARNVLPPVCRLFGTARALNNSTLFGLRRKIQSMTQATAKAHGCRAKVDFISGYPPLVNDRSANLQLLRGAVESLGAKAVKDIDNPLLGGEDFARYLEHAPGAMFHLGVRNSKIGAIHGWHHPQFTADERAIGVGISTLVYAAVGYLND